MTRKTSMLPSAKALLLGASLSTACLAAPSLAAGITSSGATNLIANGDFETGALSPWKGSNGVGIDAAFPGQGRFDASFSTVSSVPATLSQEIATAPGGIYRLSFSLLDEAGLVFDTFTVSLGSFSATITGDRAFDPMQASFLLPSTAITGGTSTLGFSAVNDGAAFNLDDVSLVLLAQAVPEPSSMLLVLLPILGVVGASWRRARRRILMP